MITDIDPSTTFTFKVAFKEAGAGDLDGVTVAVGVGVCVCV